MPKATRIELRWAISSVVERIVCIDEVADSISASSKLICTLLQCKNIHIYYKIKTKIKNFLFYFILLFDFQTRKHITPLGDSTAP